VTADQVSGAIKSYGGGGGGNNDEAPKTDEYKSEESKDSYGAEKTEEVR
jgi:hypothetical protein